MTKHFCTGRLSSPAVHRNSFNTTRLKSHKGISLLELITTTGILAIVSITAIPELTHLIRNTETQIIIGNVFRNLQYARNLALAEGTPVSLCASADGINCQGRQWQTGGIIFRDKNGNGRRDSTDEITKIIEPFKNDSQLIWRAFQNKAHLTFTEEGVTNYQNGNFTYCPEDKNLQYAAQVIVSYSGRPRYAQDNNGDGIANGSNGKNIKCN